MLLDDADGLAAALAQMRAGQPGRARNADVYEVVALCWREQWEPAFLRAVRMLASLGSDEPWAENLLTAARFAAARQLGRSVPDLGEAILERLAAHSFTRAWAERLRALC